MIENGKVLNHLRKTIAAFKDSENSDDNLLKSSDVDMALSHNGVSQ